MLVLNLTEFLDPIDLVEGLFVNYFLLVVVEELISQANS